MTTATAEAKPAVRKGRKPYHDLPPPIQLVTVEQFAQEHQALPASKVRKLVHRADAGDPEFIGFRRAVVRVGRSLFINRLAANEWLAQRSAMPPAPARNTGDRDRQERRSQTLAAKTTKRAKVAA